MFIQNSFTIQGYMEMFRNSWIFFYLKIKKEQSFPHVPWNKPFRYFSTYPLKIFGRIFRENTASYERRKLERKLRRTRILSW